MHEREQTKPLGDLWVYIMVVINPLMVVINPLMVVINPLIIVLLEVLG